jgi:hypothetical protein
MFWAFKFLTHPQISVLQVCSQSIFDLIQSCDVFQKRGHSFAEEGTCKKKLATSPSSSSMGDRQVCSCLLVVDRVFPLLTAFTCRSN